MKYAFEQLQVKFLDYGNICTVGYIDLRVITPELASPPQWVYEFTLHNLSPVSEFNNYQLVVGVYLLFGCLVFTSSQSFVLQPGDHQ